MEFKFAFKRLNGDRQEGKRGKEVQSKITELLSLSKPQPFFKIISNRHSRLRNVNFGTKPRVFVNVGVSNSQILYAAITLNTAITTSTLEPTV
jgi:hypothetical protein